MRLDIALRWHTCIKRSSLVFDGLAEADGENESEVELGYRERPQKCGKAKWDEGRISW